MSFDAKRLRSFRKLRTAEAKRLPAGDSYLRSLDAECFRIAAALIAGKPAEA